MCQTCGNKNAKEGMPMQLKEHVGENDCSQRERLAICRAVGKKNNAICRPLFLAKNHQIMQKMKTVTGRGSFLITGAQEQYED